MDLAILEKRDGLPELIRRKLGQTPVHYARQMEVISSHRKRGQPWQPAGVLIPLCYKDRFQGYDESRGGHVIQLIRRSSTVAQGGDLSGPGGMLSPRMDSMLRLPIAWGLTPIMQDKAKEPVRNRGDDEFAAISLFLANALRECWEEIRLNPLNVAFLGALPFQNLVLFTRTIFPLVGLVKRDRPYRPNHEVDRVVEIPLAAFFDKNCYATYCVHNSHRHDSESFETPCLVWKSTDGEEDILWGATLRIVLDFLRIVFDVDLPMTGNSRIVSRTLSEDYMKGNGPP